jgi:hypothetical protein
MTAGRIFKRHLIGALFGVLLIVALTPVIRLLMMEATFMRASRQVPGVAYTGLIRVEPWSCYHPAYKRKVQREKIRCYVRLKLIDQAFELAEQIHTDTVPCTTPDQDIWEKALIYPYRGLALLLERWPRYADLGNTIGYDTLREELEAANQTDALARLAALTRTLPEPAPAPNALFSGTPASAGPAHEETVSIPAARPTMQPTMPTQTATAPQQPQMPQTTPQTRPAKTEAQGWAISVSEESRIYTPEGKFLRRIPPAKLLSVIGEQDANSIGRLFSCTTYPNGTTPFLIRVSDVEYYDSDISTIDPSVVDMLVTRIALEERIRQRREQFKEEAKQRNPHYAAYQQKLGEYRDFMSESKRLTKLRDEATGARRVDISAKLNEMMQAGARIDRAYRSIKREYEAWNKQNATEVNLNQDAQIQQMQRQQEQIEAKLKDIVTIQS